MANQAVSEELASLLAKTDMQTGEQLSKTCADAV